MTPKVNKTFIYTLVAFRQGHFNECSMKVAKEKLDRNIAVAMRF